MGNGSMTVCEARPWETVCEARPWETVGDRGRPFLRYLVLWLTMGTVGDRGRPYGQCAKHDDGNRGNSVDSVDSGNHSWHDEHGLPRFATVCHGKERFAHYNKNKTGTS